MKVCLPYSVDWILRIPTGNNFACSFNPAPNPSPHSRRAQPTCRRAPTPTSPPTFSSTSLSTTLFQACVTPPLATTFDESALDAASPGTKPFKWPKPAKSPAPPSTRHYQLPPHSTPCVRRHRTLLTPPRPFPTIAQCRRKLITATPATRSFANFPEDHATPARTRVPRLLTSRHSPILSVHRRPDGPLTLATAPLYAHPLNCMYLNHSGISARTQGLREHSRYASWRRTLISTRGSNRLINCHCNTRRALLQSSRRPIVPLPPRRRPNTRTQARVVAIFLHFSYSHTTVPSLPSRATHSNPTDRRSLLTL